MLLELPLRLSAIVVLAAGQSWDSWEDSYFQPLGKGTKLGDLQRLEIMNSEKGVQKGPKAAKARSWQKWEDMEFGHSMQAVAGRRLPVLKRSSAHQSKRGKESVVEQMASKSWVSTAEVDHPDQHKAQRFVDTIA